MMYRALFMLLILATALAGCDVWRMNAGASKTLQAVSLGGDPVAVECKYATSIYSDQLSTDGSFYVSDVPVDQLLAGDFQTGQVVHIEKLWHPKAGKTPLDRAACRASRRVLSSAAVAIVTSCSSTARSAVAPPAAAAWRLPTPLR